MRGRLHHHGRRGLVPAGVLAVGAAIASGSSVLFAGGTGVLDGGFAAAPEPTADVALEQAPLELLASSDPVERRKGAARLTEGGVSGWPDGERRAFLDAIAPLAVSSAAEHCLPASVTIAQAVQESGWGTSEKALELHNLFGMKAREPAEGVPSPTWEVVDGRTTEVVAPFRLYGSWLDSVAEHDARIATDALYAPARAVRHDREAFVGALAPIYATDPMYAERLGALIDTYDLDAFDRVALEAARLRGRCAG